MKGQVSSTLESFAETTQAKETANSKEKQSENNLLKQKFDELEKKVQQ